MRLLTLTALTVLAASLPPLAPHALAAGPASSSDTAVTRGNDELVLRLRAGLLRAEDQRNATDPVITQALQSPLGEVRARALRALGRIGDPASVPLVSKGLVDRDREAQREAVFALGEIESPAALPALMQVLSSDDAEQRALAAEALSKIAWKGSDRARAGSLVMGRILKPGAEPDAAVVARALRACWRLGTDAPGLSSTIGNMYLRPEPAISEAAVFAAARLGDAGLGSLLELALRDPRPTVRALACRGLGRLARGKGAQTQVSLPRRALLLSRAMDVEPAVRLAALSALEPFPPAEPPVVDELLSASLGHPNSELQRAGLSLVAAWRARSARDQVLLTFQAGSLDVLPETLAALVRLEGGVAVPILETIAGHADWRRRVAVADALGDPGLASHADARKLLDRLLKDRDPRVVAAALGAASGSGRHDASVLALAHLGAPDVVVRAIAASMLPDLVGEHLGKAEAAAALRRAWREASADTLADARLASLEALADVLGRDAAPDLREAASRAEWVVRLKARQLMLRLGLDPPPLGTVPLSRPLTLYMDLARQEMAGSQPTLRLETDRGILDVALASAAAPLTVFQITELARAGFFDGLMFHRVVGDFVAQGGCPRGDGWGGPPASLRCEINRLPYDRGAAGMALSGKDTGGSQFFFTLSPQPHLDGGYTVFGHLTDESLPVLDAIRRFDLIRHATIVADPGMPRVAAAR